MDLFAITCTTCKSRLKVREEGAIGQILACPKCGGMVMVKPPPNWSAGTQAKLEEPTITEVVSAGPRVDQTSGASAFEAVEDLLSDAPPRTQTPATATLPAPVAAAPAPARPRFVGGPAPAPRAAAAGQADAAALAPPPPAEMEAAQSAAEAEVGQGRYWLMMAGSVAVGIVLAFAGVWGARHFLRGNKPALADASQQRPSADTASPDTAPAATPVASPRVETPAPSVPPPADGAAGEQETSPAPTPDPAPPGGATDPIGLVKSPEVPAVAPADPSDPLAKFDRLIGGEPEPAEDPAAAPGSEPAAPIDSAPPRPTLPRPPPREVDVNRRLADPLLAIETTGTPLADFLERLAELSTISITLDPDWLAFAPASTETPVVLRADNTTVAGALTKALEPLRLAPVVAGDQIVVGLAQPQPLVTIQVKVKELAATEEELSELMEMLKGLIEPATWTGGEAGGSLVGNAAAGTLHVTHFKVVQAQVHLVCEKLRTARQKPHVLRLDPGLFELATRTARAQASLETPVSLTFSQSTRLTAILDRLSEAGGVRILVDWRDIAASGWNPDADATLVADKQPLGAALDALLEPMDLAWRAIDGRTLQVVTAARLAEQLEIEFYSVADLVADDPGGEALQTKLREAVGPVHFLGGGGSGQLRFDEAGKCLIASLPQPKQRELEGLLGKWRGEAAPK